MAFYASQVAASGGEQSMGGSTLPRKMKFQGGPLGKMTQSAAMQASMAAWQAMTPEARARFTASRPMVPGVATAAPAAAPMQTTPAPALGRFATPSNMLSTLGVTPPPAPVMAPNKPMIPSTSAAPPPQVINGAVSRSPTETQFQTGTVMTNAQTGSKTLQSQYGTGSATFNQPKRTGPTVFDGGKPVDMAASRQAGTIVTTPTAPNKPMLPVTKPAPSMAMTPPKSSATVQSPVATPAAKPVVAAAPPNKPAPPTFVTMSPDQRQAYLQQQINAPAPTGPSVLQRAKANQTYPDVNAIRQARADQEAAKPLISKAAGAVASAASLAGQGISQLSQVGTGMVGTAVGIGKDLAKATFVGDPDKAKKAAATLQAAKPMLPPMARR